MLKKFISIFLVLIMCFSLLGMKAAPVPNETSQKLDEYMTALQNNRNFHGSVLVAKEGNILLQKGYGMADVKNKIEVSKGTRFAIGSVTKQFTAMAIMQLYERGKLSLNDKLTKYVPDFKYGGNITLHNLLTHTSGIPDYLGMSRVYSLDLNGTRLKMIINILKDQPLRFKPGEKFEYSNSGYLLLTYIIEKVSGLSYDNYLDKNIFKPLGMSNTGDCYLRGKNVLKTVGYTGFLEYKPVNDTILGISFGAGELYSTTEDLYKWDRALYTDKLLKKADLKKMFTGYKNTFDMYSYGYGFFIGDTRYGEEIMHTGGTMSFCSLISRYIDKNVTIIVLVNNVPISLNSIKTTLENIVFGNQFEIPSPLIEVQTDKSLYKNYVGIYSAAGLNIKISTDGNHLFALINGQQNLELLPESESRFFSKEVDLEITFDIDANSKVAGLTLHQDGKDYSAGKQGIK